jgi:hypothetical protein
MATYKVLQDIEADDKLLGPLSLKQFIFAIITIGIGFIQFKLIVTTSLGIMRWPFVFVFLWPMLLFGFLAAPISRDQPNDIWLIARIRYLLKPHRRIWDQSGLKQLVTIMAPKKIEIDRTNGLSQNEVRSRLQALANTIDSRGWAIKNVNVNLYSQPGYLATDVDSDRLINPVNLPQDVPAVDIGAADDIMDSGSNPVAQHLDQMMHASDEAHRQQVLQQIKQQNGGQDGQAAADYWFMQQQAQQDQSAPAIDPGYATFGSTVVAPGADDVAAPIPEPTADEAAIIAKVEAENAHPSMWKSHLKTIQPLSNEQPVTGSDASVSAQGPAAFVADTGAPDATSIANQPKTGETPAAQPAILSLANNDDLNVATIARQAQRLNEGKDGNEVVISLH